MKKPKTDKAPSRASLKEMPEIDFHAYRVRRNPYASRIAREGIEIVHEAPSAASLAEMPEADFATARVRRNPYASRAAESLGTVSYGRGRPHAGSEQGPTPARSLRLPIAVWTLLEEEARSRHTTVHALLREIVVTYLERSLRK